jgi:hypothetical protein
MSAEPVKKRGRPKKVISDPGEVIIPEGTKKATTRSKSTAAAPKTKIAPQKPQPMVKPAAKTLSTSLPAQSTNSKPPIPKEPTKIVQPAKPTPKSPVTPETSRILSQVRELSAKKPVPPGDFKKSSKPSPTSIPSKPQPSKSTPLPPSKSPAPAAIPAQSTKTAPQSTPQSYTPPPNISQPSLSKPAAKIPIASLNSQIVDNIATRAGARPNTAGSKSSLPPNYKPVARKVTMTIVAMPILLVTSWVLYERCELFHWVRGDDTDALNSDIRRGTEITGEAGLDNG